MIRLLLIPGILQSIRNPNQRQRTIVLVALALLTDVIDGPIARSRNETSNLGKILDPITDKLLINGTAVTLASEGRFPVWAVRLLFTRDLAILLGGLVIYLRHAELKMAQPLGKATTAGFGATLLLELIDGQRSSRPVLWLTMLAMAGSIVQYTQTLLRAIR
jgi:CDP-diacylglycerol--glycerol-3-phosphate 3-phosphatidyltransferase